MKQADKLLVRGESLSPMRAEWAHGPRWPSLLER
jgi:hypothetical protein